MSLEGVNTLEVDVLLQCSALTLISANLQTSWHQRLSEFVAMTTTFMGAQMIRGPIIIPGALDMETPTFHVA